MMSCAAAVFVNYSQIVCIKQLSPTGFQVLGNAKTVFILLFGFLFFDGKVSTQTLFGQGLAVIGMFIYAVSAGKESKAVAVHHTKPSTKPEVDAPQSS